MFLFQLSSLQNRILLWVNIVGGGVPVCRNYHLDRAEGVDWLQREKTKALERINFKILFTAEASITFRPYLPNVRHWLKCSLESGTDGANDSFNTKESMVESKLKTMYINFWTVNQ